MNELYLITGAAGHLGSTLVSKLLQLNKQVRGLVLPGEKNIPQGNLEIYYGDICQKDSLTRFFDNPKTKDLIVIHCAGIVSISSRFDQLVYDVNTLGTKNMVDLCQQHSVKKLVFVSSVHAIPEKEKGQTIVEINDFQADKVIGLYAKTKAEASHYVLLAAKEGLNASIVFPSGLVGPFDQGKGPLTSLIINYAKGKITSGVKGGFDFVDVRDVADGIIACAEKGQAGEGYILSNKRFLISEILDMLHEITGGRKIKRFLPLWFLKLMAFPTEIYYKLVKEKPLFTPYSLYTLNTNGLYSHQKASQELDYQTREMRDTLEDTFHWLKNQKRI